MMLLGKRPRPPMKRTTSMSEIIFDLNTNNEGAPPTDHVTQRQPGFGGQLDQRFSAATAQSRTHWGTSADCLDTAHFLKACAFCKRGLFPGRDIYMYRGDSAFCSLECRQQQMNQDERKERCSIMASNKQVASSTTGSEVSTNGEAVALV